MRMRFAATVNLDRGRKAVYIYLEGGGMFVS